MIKKFSSPKMRNREFVFTPKIEYQLVAESANSADKLREADQNSLTFPFWCTCEESNLNYKIRNLVSYPLNDRCILFYHRTLINLKPFFLRRSPAKALASAGPLNDRCPTSPRLRRASPN